ncbi:MAG: hypothetical protein HWE26_13785 [Alteromonadaceae bacterium]|nr:hypothetical protein [Alteromonadaceae bacterium]
MDDLEAQNTAKPDLDAVPVDLLELVEGYLKLSGCGRTYFGRLACGNSRLVDRLRNGETVTERTGQRVRDYIKTQTPIVKARKEAAFLKERRARLRSAFAEVIENGRGK